MAFIFRLIPSISVPFDVIMGNTTWRSYRGQSTKLLQQPRANLMSWGILILGWLRPVYNFCIDIWKTSILLGKYWKQKQKEHENSWVTKVIASLMGMMLKIFQKTRAYLPDNLQGVIFVASPSRDCMGIEFHARKLVTNLALWVGNFKHPHQQWGNSHERRPPAIPRTRKEILFWEELYVQIRTGRILD